MKKDNIILIGFMGCGKTSVGIRLSYALRRTLIDTDKWIEKKQGMTISKIFAKEGETAFRNLETACIEELIETENHRIIATGGGMPLRSENAALLKKLGTVVYLRVDAQTVYERLKGDTTRPLLACENPMQRITELLSQRKALYEACADVIIDVPKRSFEEIVTCICEGAGIEKPVKRDGKGE